VFGIILDTFGTLRDAKTAIDEDIQSNCFICSLPADLFNRAALGWDHHIKYEHNMWKYLYFFVHLEMKDKDEFTSAEEYVFNQKEEGLIAYFPVGRAICVENFGKK